MAISTHKRFDVDEIRRKNPLPDVVPSYGIQLRRSGRALVGLCPFHDDRRDPNLWVYPVTMSWYCWACEKGGDVIQFVMLKEGLTFVEACGKLEGSPASAGPPAASRVPPARERRWDRLTLEQQAVMNTACALYRDALWHDPQARTYVRERGLPDWVVRQSGLGFADGHSLEVYLRRRSGLRTAEELGLLRKPERGDGPSSLREFLGGRIVVPEIRSGQCVWFIGRALADRPGRPKYLALGGERPVLGLERAVGRREVFLCEGVFDWLTALSWNLAAFSPCGTHLPAERLGFLARARLVYGVLDGDEAGRAAGERFAEQLGSRFRLIPLPEGSDLNDLGRRPGGREEFFQLLAVAREVHREEVGHGE